MPTTKLLSPRRPRCASLVLLVALACSGGGGDSPEPTEPTEPGGPPASRTPSRIVPVEGATSQTAVVGSAVAVAPAVKVTASDGSPVSGVTVSFTAAGGGQLGATSAQTNASGIASAGSWTLGTTAGEQTVTAKVNALTTQLKATATPGPAAHLEVVGGAGQSGATGTALSAPVIVRATDSYGNRVPGVLVLFEPAAGSGSAAPTQGETNASGEVQTVWTLGTTDGTQSLGVRIAGQTAVAASVSAAATGPVLLASRVEVFSSFSRCALRETGGIVCWGVNSAGDLGDGTTTFRELPVSLAIDGVAFTQVAGGTHFGCALSDAGAAYCWGQNDDHQLGDGTDEDRHTPVPVAGGHVFTAIAAGTTTACALDDAGLAWCWGTLGIDASSAHPEPTLVSSSLHFTAIAAGTDHHCAIATDGQSYCWGDGANGKLGNDASARSDAPVPVAGGQRFASVTLGSNHGCGLTADGAAYCWGLNADGQLGDGTTTTRTTPVPAAASLRFVALDAGRAHTCGVTAAGEAYCWGADESAQLGDGRVIGGPNPTPLRVPLPAGVQLRTISGGSAATCGVATTGTVYCWGTRAVITPTSVTFEVDRAPVTVRTR
ncbi:MAG TPA: hypothetical protein VFS08_06175 [Gemmatimonadaceae bacterium]|nr:hypothetical protein [Gemmatimonadaceae bacterium]